MTATSSSEPFPASPAQVQTGSRPPKRPWEVRLLNGTLRFLERIGLRTFQLDVDRLIRAAQRETGLDFSERSFEAPLRVLVQSMRDEGRLNPYGRICLFYGIIHSLKCRLWLELERREHPEVFREPVRRPLYVIGLPRTGTTLLYNLLCQDPQGRPLLGWESMMPVAPRSRRGKPVRDYRLDLANGIERGMQRVAPQLKAVHEFSTDGPEECTWLLHSTFLSPSYLIQANLPSYYEYLGRLSREECRGAYRLYAQMLQWLQSESAATHWVLKSPVHLSSLGPLLDVIPDACIVQTHRDPLKVIGSCCSMYSVVRRIYSDDVDDHQLGQDLLPGLAGVAALARQTRQEYPAQIMDVEYDALVQDPLGTVRRIYDRFGYPFDPRMEAGIQRWLTEHPQGKHGVHRYDLAQFGLTEAQVRDAFAASRSA